ncbi:MAG: hypothetical protein Q8M23_09005, partial [Bacteroidales bacterium]|nr:hypothetical protein [Bacteroidales bacterium]
LFLSIVFATGVLFYSTFEAAMSHVYSFMLFSLFIWLSIKWHQKPSTFTTIWLGLTFGLIALIRPSNGLVVLFFILYNIKTMHEAGPRIRLFVRSWHQILLIIFLAVLVFTPQLFYWKFSTGQWFFYSYGDEKFFFLQPNILNGLFSYRKGWLLYTPIMIVALAGFYPLYKRYRQFFLAILVFTVLNIYVVYSWWDWWYGGGLGSRPMIDSYALMVIPLAAFITWISTRTWGKILAVIMVIIFGCHGIFQTMQYRYGALHYMAMTKKAYWHSFGRIRPKYPFYDYIEYPDIMQARKGIQAAALKSKQTFEAFITCNYEVLTDNGEFFYSTDKEFLLSGVGKRSDEHARSGIYSMMLYKQEQFGSDMLLKVEPGEGFRLSVWKYPARATGGVALTAPLEANYYNFSQVVSAEDEIGWGKVELEVKIPDTLSGLMKIYLWNPGKEKVYFDDLTIEKIAHKP